MMRRIATLPWDSCAQARDWRRAAMTFVILRDKLKGNMNGAKRARTEGAYLFDTGAHCKLNRAVGDECASCPSRRSDAFHKFIWATDSLSFHSVAKALA
jgi:hypothetical protein